MCFYMWPDPVNTTTNFNHFPDVLFNPIGIDQEGRGKDIALIINFIPHNQDFVSYKQSDSEYCSGLS